MIGNYHCKSIHWRDVRHKCRYIHCYRSFVFVDYLEPDQHVRESQPSGPGAGTKPEESYSEIPDNALDNPEYFAGPLGGGLGMGGGKPLPPDPRTTSVNNNNIDDPALGVKEAAAPRLRKLGPPTPMPPSAGSADPSNPADTYINTDYDHLGNHAQSHTPLSYINPRSESMV